MKWEKMSFGKVRWKKNWKDRNRQKQRQRQREKCEIYEIFLKIKMMGINWVSVFESIAKLLFYENIIANLIFPLIFSESQRDLYFLYPPHTMENENTLIFIVYRRLSKRKTCNKDLPKSNYTMVSK